MTVFVTGGLGFIGSNFGGGSSTTSQSLIFFAIFSSIDAEIEEIN